MIRGIGVDIVEIARVRKAMENPRFSLRVFTEDERSALAHRPPASAAGLWAAKEAVTKALGTGFHGFALQDVEIVHEESGAPQALLHRGAQARLVHLGATRVHVSISHSGDNAIAFAILE